MDHNRPRREANHSRIIVADDHPLFRSALVQILESQSDLEVVGEATDGREAIELCRHLRPDLVLMDIGMPVMDGVEATRKIKDLLPRTIVMVLTASAEPDELARALRAGALGYVLKVAPPMEVIEAIRQVLVGGASLNRDVSTRLLMELLKEEPREEIPERGGGLLASLSPREVEVLRLIARGQTNHQIAHELLLSVSTVKKHVRSAISKLGASDRTQAAVMAVELGVTAGNQAYRPAPRHRTSPPSSGS